jgi:chorismate mutase/prephenate dehydratase
MSISRKFQSSRLRSFSVGFPGKPGSFSEQALVEFFGEKVERVTMRDFEDVFKALQDETIEYGVLPIENTSTGGIAEVYDLIRKYGFYIIGEKIIKIDHNLLAIKGAKLEDIREVYSHPQGFSQSCEFFKQHANWKLIPYVNTATSAKLVKDQNEISKAAVASKKAAELYGLTILEKNINFSNHNYTRFIIVRKKIETDPSHDKISIVFSLPHKAGSLYHVLQHFSDNGLNLLKIESRPILDKSWQYFFYIDFQGNLQEATTKTAISALEKHSNYFRLLGNYKADAMNIE